jgi:hypothetical protein
LNSPFLAGDLEHVVQDRELLPHRGEADETQPLVAISGKVRQGERRHRSLTEGVTEEGPQNCVLDRGTLLARADCLHVARHKVGEGDALVAVRQARRLAGSEGEVSLFVSIERRLDGTRPDLGLAAGRMGAGQGRVAVAPDLRLPAVASASDGGHGRSLAVTVAVTAVDRLGAGGG